MSCTALLTGVAGWNVNIKMICADSAAAEVLETIERRKYPPSADRS